MGLYAWQSTLALLVAAPAASLARTAYGHDPRGDAPLWASQGDGGRALLDFLWHEQHGIGAIGSTAQSVLLFALVAGLVPMAAAHVAIAYAANDRSRVGLARSIARGLRAFPAMLILLGVTGAVLVVVALSGVMVNEVVEAWCHARWGEAHAQQVAAVAIVPLLGAASVVAVVHDLARAAVVRFTTGAWRGLSFGVAAFRRAPLALWWSWAWRALASLVPVAAAAFVVGRGPSRVGPVALLVVLLAVLHQAVVLSRVAIRVSWWARALRAVDAGHVGGGPEAHETVTPE